MIDTPRRALLGALIAAPMAVTAANARPIESAPSDPSWTALHERWQRANADYRAAVSAQEGAETALALNRCVATVEAEAAGYRRACRTGLRCRRLSEAAAMKPANDWPALALKLEIAGNDGMGAGLDVLSCDLRPQHWQRLVSEIHAAMRQLRAT